MPKINVTDIPDGFNENGKHALSVTLHQVKEYIEYFATVWDLASLENVTLAGDYDKALLDFSEITGREPVRKSTDYGVGVGMTIPIKTGNSLANHIFFDLNAVFPVLHKNSDIDIEKEAWGNAVYIIAHECAHVEINFYCDNLVPERGVSATCPNIVKAYQWGTTTRCWNEYAACRLSAEYGADQTDNCEDLFLFELKRTRELADKYITAYRDDHDLITVVEKVWSQYSALLTKASYHLGNLKGRNLQIAECPKTTDALKNHWFESIFYELDRSLNGAFDKYLNKTLCSNDFSKVDELSRELVEHGGMIFKIGDDHSVTVSIPL